MKISAERMELVDINTLIGYARNARTHSKEQILQLRSSLREFGFVNPVLCDKDLNIIAGHGRVLAAKAEGFTEVPCVFVEHLTDAQKRAYILADNRLGLNAGWDDELLALEFSELKDLGFDLDLTGFDPAEIEKLFAAESGDVQDDDFDVGAAVGEPPFVLLGDLWHLGRHRLLCGDATKSEDVARLMDGKKANLLLTDPPYGVSYEGKAGKITNDELRGEEFYKFLLAAFTATETALDDEGSAYIFHADTQGEHFRRAFREAGFKLSGVCQWVKPSLVLGRSPYQWQNEPVLFGWKSKGKHKWFAGRAETTIWNFDKPKKNDIHCTMKPIPLLAYPIKNSTAPNAIVLDVFSGSFSTGMACEQINRTCYALEIDPKYASASITRFHESFPNETISVERNGEVLPFAEVAKCDK
jgi:DNA modification methylase